MQKIIIVDDEPLAIERLRNLISHNEGYEIVGEYGCAQDAIAGAGQIQPDIVITDICMAKVDGLSMIEEMQKIWGDQIGFIIVSGYGQFDYAKKALDLRVGAYLLKPVIESELEDALHKVSKQQGLLRYQQDELDMGSLISREDMRDRINQADTIISAVLEYNESELDACIDNIPHIYAECEDPIAAMNNFCWLIFALLDSRMGNKKYDFQNLWYSSVGTRFDAFDEDTKKKIKDVLEKCMLVIMEKRGYHKKHVISYMKLYMYQYYAKDLSLSWFADQLFINTAYLGQKFKKETGESVNSFLHKIRIAKAKELSKKTNMTWREIADAVGYKSYLGFFEHFMKIEGIAPSDYRI